jgi:hypothetical protein
MDSPKDLLRDIVRIGIVQQDGINNGPNPIDMAREERIQSPGIPFSLISGYQLFIVHPDQAHSPLLTY